MKIAKNIGKPMFFHQFSRFWEDSGAQKMKKIEKKTSREAKRGEERPKRKPREAQGGLRERNMTPNRAQEGPGGAQKGHDPDWQAVECCNFGPPDPPKGSKILIILDLRSK